MKENIDDQKEKSVKEYRLNLTETSYNQWLIFKSDNSTKDNSIELKKFLPPYFESSNSKTNDFSVRDNLSNPPSPYEFFEVLLNGILLRNELGLYQSKYKYYKELQQSLIEYIKIFYYRIDTLINAFQTIAKVNLSKEKYPKIVVKCGNCSVFVYIDVYCHICQNEFYCDETCMKVHSKEMHNNNINTNKNNNYSNINSNENPQCVSFGLIPKIYEPIRIEVHISSNSLGEEILIYSEHNMKYCRMSKGRILLSFLYKTIKKDRWYRNNKYTIYEYISKDMLAIRRGIDMENIDDDKNTDNINKSHDNKRKIVEKDFLNRLIIKNLEYYYEDEFRDILRLSIVQELKYDFYKLGAMMVDVIKENKLGCYMYIFIFDFP